MRKSNLLICMLLVAMVLSCSTILSFPLNYYSDDLSSGWYLSVSKFNSSTGDGPFVVNSKNSNGTSANFFDSFETFCIETQEVFYLDSLMRIDSVGETIVNGAPGTPQSTQLQDKTAWLYYQYRLGAAGVFNSMFNGSGAIANYNQLQRAIWYAQGQLTSSAVNGFYDPNNSSIDGHTNNDFWDMAAFASPEELKIAQDHIVVFNPVDLSGNARQSFMATVTVPTVPEPGLLTMIGLGLLGIGTSLHRRK